MKKIILFTVLTISAFTDLLCAKKNETTTPKTGEIIVVNNNPYPVTVVLEARLQNRNITTHVRPNSSETVEIGTRAIRKVSVKNGPALDILETQKVSLKTGKIVIQGNQIVLQGGEAALFN